MTLTVIVTLTLTLTMVVIGGMTRGGHGGEGDDAGVTSAPRLDVAN